MKFNEALELLLQGKKVKLSHWGGYWIWNNELHTVMMVPWDGTIEDATDIRNSNRVEYTLKNIASEEWVLADETNASPLGGEAELTFSEALTQIKHGRKMRRKSWEDPKKVVKMDKKNGLFGFKHKSKLSLTCITSRGKHLEWTPETEDLFGTDWVYVNK